MHIHLPAPSFGEVPPASDAALGRRRWVRVRHGGAGGGCVAVRHGRESNAVGGHTARNARASPSCAMRGAFHRAARAASLSPSRHPMAASRRGLPSAIPRAGECAFRGTNGLLPVETSLNDDSSGGDLVSSSEMRWVEEEPRQKRRTSECKLTMLTELNLSCELTLTDAHVEFSGHLTPRASPRRLQRRRRRRRRRQRHGGAEGCTEGAARDADGGQAHTRAMYTVRDGQQDVTLHTHQGGHASGQALAVLNAQGCTGQHRVLGLGYGVATGKGR